jgi:chitin disaccharide deacetylase
MANTAGFEEACNLAKKYELADRIGIHLNITEGEPLSHDIRAFAAFCASEERLSYSRGSRFILTRNEIVGLQEEIPLRHLRYTASPPASHTS